jgi:hypothetical protein
MKAYTWELEMDFSGLAAFFGGGGDGSGDGSANWYSEDLDHDDGGTSSDVTMVRFAIPALLGAMLLATIGAAMAFATKKRAGPALVVAAGGSAAVGTILFASGLHGIFDGDPAWQPSFYLAIAASVLLLAGGIVGLVTGPPDPTAVARARS